jgi:tetratricopeptide (TPR) repeat protein
MQSLVQALVHQRNFEHEKSNSHWHNLAVTYPKNNYLLTNMAQVAFEQEQTDSAMALYRQVRRLDSAVVRGTDALGRILHKAEDAPELSKLANDVLDCSPHRPEGWLVAALFCDLKGDPEKSFTLIDKATQIDPKFATNFKIKGQLLHAQGNFEQAYIAFSQANSLDKDMTSYAGMIAASIALGKLKDAVNVSRESIIYMPRSATAYLLLANVIAKSPQGAVESVRAYSKALKLSPLNKMAVQGMAQVYLDDEKFEEAATCLTEALTKVSCYRLQLLLAKAQAGAGLYND